MLVVFLAAGELAQADALRRSVDRDRLGFGAHVDAVTLAEEVGGSHQQLAALGDRSGNVVR